MRRRTMLKSIGAAGVLGLAGCTGEDGGGEIELVGEVTTPGAREVVAGDDYAYVGNGELEWGPGVTVVDWSDPAEPEQVATLDLPGPEHAGVSLEGDLLATSNDAFGSRKVDPEQIGAHFVDVSDPTDPELVGSFDVNPPDEEQLGAHNLYLEGDVAYLTRFFPRSNSELILVDVSDPSDPVELSRWSLGDQHPELNNRLANVHQVYVQDGTAYTANWDAGCRVIDVSDPTDPVEVAGFGATEDLADAPESSEEFRERFSLPPGNVHSVRVTPDDEYAFLASETGQIVGGPPDTLGGIRVFDISDLDSPELVAEIEPPGIERDDDFEKGGTVHNLALRGDQLHTAWYAGGVRVFDVSDPANPEQLDRFDPEGTEIAYDTVSTSGDYTLATRRTFSVVTLDTGGL